jgi:hypothetical protein
VSYTRDYLLTYGSCRVASVAAGTGVYTLDTTTDPFGEKLDWIKLGIQIRIYGCANALNNGLFTVTSVAGAVIGTSNAASVLDAASTGKMGYPIGGASGNVLTDVSTHMVGYDAAEVTFKFEVADQNENTFGLKIAAAESLFRTPRMDFSWLNGSTEILPLKHSDGTGFDAEPKIEKREDKHSGRSRVYTISIRFGMPADVVKTQGRREATINVSYSPARRRRVTIQGTWTVIPPRTVQARAQYESSIAAYCLVVLTGLGLTATTSELAEEPTTIHNDTNSTLQFTRIFDEIIFGQGGGANDAAIVRQVTKVRRQKVAPGDTPTANRLATLQMTYDAWIDKTVTTDLRGKYESIRDWLVAVARATLSGGGAVALVDDSPEFDFDENRISASLTLMASTGGSVFENTITTETFDQYGAVLVPVWDGNPLTKYNYQGPARKLKTVTHIWKDLGAGSSSSRSGSGASGDFFSYGGQVFAGFGVGVSGGFSFPGGGGVSIFGGPASGQSQSDLAAWAQGLPTSQDQGAGGGGPGAAAGNGLSVVIVDYRESTTPKQMGLQGYTIDYTEHMTVQNFEYFSPPSGGGGGGPPPVASGSGQSGFGLGSS